MHALAPPSHACSACCLCCCLCAVQIVFEEFGFSSFLEAPASYFSLQYACTLPPLQTVTPPPGEAATRPLVQCHTTASLLSLCHYVMPSNKPQF
jgi:hypothetical protein